MERIKSFFISEINSFKQSITKIEYILWWAIRALMIFALVRLVIKDPTNNNVVLLSLNLLATFTVPLARILLFPKRLLKKLNFRAQTYLDIMIFFGSFLGQGMEFNSKITSNDKILHVLAGAIILLIGNELVDLFMDNCDHISPLLRTFTATGFSFIAIVLWEVFEFFADYYIPNSTNQAYSISPERDPFFFKIFGYGAQNENQWAVFDTNVDMICAVVGCIPTAILLLLHLNKKQKLQTTIM